MDTKEEHHVKTIVTVSSSLDQNMLDGQVESSFIGSLADKNFMNVTKYVKQELDDIPVGSERETKKQVVELEDALTHTFDIGQMNFKVELETDKLCEEFYNRHEETVGLDGQNPEGDFRCLACYTKFEDRISYLDHRQHCSGGLDVHQGPVKSEDIKAPEILCQGPIKLEDIKAPGILLQDGSDLLAKQQAVDRNNIYTEPLLQISSASNFSGLSNDGDEQNSVTFPGQDVSTKFAMPMLLIQNQNCQDDCENFQETVEKNSTGDKKKGRGRRNSLREKKKVTSYHSKDINPEPGHSSGGRKKEERSDRCLYCRSVAGSAQEYKKHLQLHLKRLHKICDSMKTMKSQKERLLCHLESRKLDFPVISCKGRKCYMLFLDKTLATKHYLQCHKLNGTGFVCSKEGCNRLFKDKGAWRSHEISDHAKLVCAENQGLEISENLDCKKSGKNETTFQEVYNMAYNMAYTKIQNKKASRKAKRVFKCDKEHCLKSFQTQSALKSHVICDHTYNRVKSKEELLNILPKQDTTSDNLSDKSVKNTPEVADKDSVTTQQAETGNQSRNRSFLGVVADVFREHLYPDFSKSHHDASAKSSEKVSRDCSCCLERKKRKSSAKVSPDNSNDSGSLGKSQKRRKVKVMHSTSSCSVCPQEKTTKMVKPSTVSLPQEKLTGNVCSKSSETDSVKEESFVCKFTDCGKVFTSSLERKEHIKDTHLTVDRGNVKEEVT